MAIIFNFIDVKDNLQRKNAIKSWIKDVVSKHKKTLGEVSYIFCNDNYLLNINNTYLKHNYYTDVITFDYSEKEIISGDIFISLERVEDNAKKMNVSYQEELNRVIIHGILHLLDYRDKTIEEEKQMRKKEEECLKSLM
ncbi:MAG: rRNA maturation RNase YbeY [Bacteroidales bacterium]|jgi:rRNA maturation RNase YbeY|nr:rRNA maturation RNase YbeY [Bacteroidales bacterium]